MKSDIATGSPWGYIGGMPSQNEFPNNDHIINFLDYYTGLTSPPHYAVLLTGDWGIGKTFFILDYMKRVEERNAGKKSTEDEARKDDSRAIIKVSLNGVQSKDEIDNMIIRAFHPSLAKKGTGIMGKVITSAASIFNADLSNFQASDFLNVYRKETIYVFDDLERCGMPIESILGYINTFVEEEGCKVIIIGNEEEICKGEDEQKNKSYDKIREKVIGKTLRMMPETENAFNYFLEQLTDSETKRFLKSQKNTVSNIYQISGLNNLRILQQTISDFERLYKYIGRVCENFKNYNTNYDFKYFPEDFVYMFFAFSFEIKSRNTICDDLIFFIKKHYHNMDRFEVERDKEKPEIFSKYRSLFYIVFFYRMFSPTTLCHIFEDGLIYKDEIVNDLNESAYFYKNEVWVQLADWDWRRPEEWVPLLKKFEDEFTNRAYTRIHDILHVFALKIFFAKNGVIKENVSKVLSDCKLYIDDIFTKIQDFSWYSYESFEEPIFLETNYPQIETEEWKELVLILKKKVYEKRKNEFIKSIKEKMFSLERMRVAPSVPPEFNDISILDLFDISDICNYMKQCSYLEFIDIFNIIEHRDCSENLSVQNKELKNIKSIKNNLICMIKKLNHEDSRDMIMKIKLEYFIMYIDRWIFSSLCNNDIKHTEEKLSYHQMEESCQTGNPV